MNHVQEVSVTGAEMQCNAVLHCHVFCCCSVPTGSLLRREVKRVEPGEKFQSELLILVPKPSSTPAGTGSTSCWNLQSVTVELQRHNTCSEKTQHNSPCHSD